MVVVSGANQSAREDNRRAVADRLQRLVFEAIRTVLAQASVDRHATDSEQLVLRFFFFQAEDGIRDLIVTEFRRVLFRSVAGPPGPYGPTAAWVVAENAKPGTPNWALSNRARQHQIEGYADRVSIGVSGTVHLLVSTTAPAFKVEAYRMGYYGGAGGRRPGDPAHPA